MYARLITITAIIAALALFRVLPHPPNVSPIAAMALFGGAFYSDKRLALIVPFAALILSDIFIGLHNTMLFVYAGFALTVGIGVWLRSRYSVVSLLAATVGSSVLFFVLTNLGAWLMTGLYPPTFEGLLQAYIAAIPFFQNTLLGNLVFAAIVFGGFALLQNRFAALRNHSLA